MAHEAMYRSGSFTVRHPIFRKNFFSKDEAMYRSVRSPRFQNSWDSFTVRHPIFRKKNFSKDKPAPTRVSKDVPGHAEHLPCSFETATYAQISLEKKNFLKIEWFMARNEILFCFWEPIQVILT